MTLKKKKRWLNNKSTEAKANYLHNIWKIYTFFFFFYIFNSSQIYYLLIKAIILLQDRLLYFF